MLPLYTKTEVNYYVRVYGKCVQYSIPSNNDEYFEPFFFCQKVPYGKNLILEIYASKYNINSCIYWSQLSSFLMIT